MSVKNEKETKRRWVKKMKRRLRRMSVKNEKETKRG
jgi:hypothetical protein